jgi:hypothetical protein
VSSRGTSSGDGSRLHPLDLATAISDTSPAQPGDTVWLLSGVFRGQFTSYLTGANGQPITMRQFPGRKRATIDGSLSVQGAWTTYWGFEVRNSNPNRTASRPTGVDVLGPNNKLINLIVHDAGDGIGCWLQALESEVYGCVIYHNGWQGPDPDRGHGHGIYSQNDTGTKYFTDNIIFNQYGFGIQIYTQESSIKGYNLEGNICFENGSASRDGHRDDNIFIGGLTPAERISIISNYTFTALNHLEGSNVELGYLDTSNVDMVCRENYFAGGLAVTSVTAWQTVVISGNTVVGSPGLMRLTIDPGTDISGYQWDGNVYFPRGGSTPFIYDGQSLDLSTWQQTYGFDKTSQEVSTLSSPQIFVRPNRYEQGRLHIAVYNWGRQKSVSVNINGALPLGTKYKIYNALSYPRKPVAGGKYNGQPLRLPMNGSATGPDFNAFVLIPAS